MFGSIVFRKWGNPVSQQTPQQPAGWTGWGAQQQTQTQPIPPQAGPPVSPPPTAVPAQKKRKPWLIPLITGVVALFVGVGIGSASSGSETKTSSQPATTVTVPGPATTVTTTAAAPKAAAPTKAAAASAFPMQDGDWRLDSVTVKNDGLGDFGGRARITYTGDDPNGGDNIFTITVFKAGKDIASLQGSANTVLPGKTVTVDLISQDHYVKGPYTYDFQNNL
jgi:hypothetical protein